MAENIEIERKFFVNKLPDNLGEPVLQERYYLFNQDGIEIRIQKKEDKYYFERKVESGELSREGIKFRITEAEFGVLKQLASEKLIRKEYHISKKPDISVKVYEGRFEGLVRAEFEFSSQEEAENFTPPDWVNSEITDSPLGRDGRLVNLSQKEFGNELDKQY